MPELIPLTNGGFALVDEEDVPLVSAYKWRAQYRYRRGKRVGIACVVTGSRSGTLLLHRLVMNAPPGIEVDHVNGGPLNNTRANLRVCNHAENMRNRRRASHNKSGFKGVYLDVRAPGKSPRFRAEIRSEGKRHCLGSFQSKRQAAQAYADAAAEHHKQFARLS